MNALYCHYTLWHAQKLYTLILGKPCILCSVELSLCDSEISHSIQLRKMLYKQSQLSFINFLGTHPEINTALYTYNTVCYMFNYIVTTALCLYDANHCPRNGSVTNWGSVF